MITDKNMSIHLTRIKCLTTDTITIISMNAVLYIYVSPVTDLQIPRVSLIVPYDECLQFFPKK